GYSSATKADGTYSMKVSPGAYSVTIIDPAHLCNPIGPFNVVVNNGGTTTQNGCLSGTARFLFNSTTVSVLGGNGNGIIEPNECNILNVAIQNDGCANGVNVSATLSTTTPGVTITQPNSPYLVTAENATTPNTVPFAVSTDTAFACGTTINFTLTVTFTGGTSTFPFSVNSCQAPPIVVNGALTATDLQQEARLGRNTASSCGIPKPCPGPLGSGPRLYRTHTFTNGPAPTCVTVQTTPACPSATNPILTVAYLGSYDPSKDCNNYVGDSATVGPGNTFGFDFPANATLVLVVEEANAGLLGCSGYQLTVSGFVGSGSGNAPCAPAPSAVSRKTHGANGTYSIPLPLTGPVGVEDRTGNGGVAGSHTIVLSYTTNPVGASASIVAHNPSAATGTVSNVSFAGNDMIVNLTGVSDKQVLMLSTSGGTVSPAVVPIGFLAGDVTNNHVVNASDISEPKAQPGPPTAITFRSDVNADGNISASDTSIIKALSGNSIP
ncbi:MAG: dockerin type I domain-containing protein, partial [Nitrospirota bacterium]